MKFEKLPKVIELDTTLGIDLHTLLDIETKYKTYLETIHYFGGIMFFKHIYEFSEKSKTPTFMDIKKMEERRIITTVNFANYSYARLGKIAIKYLTKNPEPSRPKAPTSTVVKEKTFLADYIKKYHNADYTSEKNILNKHQIASDLIFKDILIQAAEDDDFLLKNKAAIRSMKTEFDNLKKSEGELLKLEKSRIFLVGYEDYVITFLILDMGRTKFWIKKAILKINQIIEKYSFYKFKILITAEDEKRLNRLKADGKKLLKELKDINSKETAFLLQDIEVYNADIEKFFLGETTNESILTEEEENQLEI